MTDPQDQARACVDFNDMEPDGRFFVRPEDVIGPLRLHEPVLLQDAEGNCASGTIAELTDGGRAMIAMLAGSWRSQEAPALAAAAPWTMQEQVANLVASYAQKATRLVSYRLSAVPSSFAALTAEPASARAQPHGAVVSSL